MSTIHISGGRVGAGHVQRSSEKLGADYENIT